MSDSIVVMTATPNKKSAVLIADGLVDEGLAACVQVIPAVISIYKWQGKKKRDQENILLIKTKKSAFKKIRKYLKENHPYELPECIALPIEAGSKAYLDWISEQVS